ncbi:MAG: hypothetical protein ACD_24C00485G0008 [uncultured bacterium]|uniref:Uncharacterized protein n=1 Tax=candidate division WWE3 bacterium RBG_16_37_10 TaxID=1802610 RepID=A0A1F4V1A7_UNCKA|nr:MAG: hypothetical protein ACD_24C00485G0008 [uncultured bacterium]OGC50977.1 MAG: hypothetical protein A2W32_04120 [candidate division WWE3 bacterium RBG_16_37_10]HBH18563.1 hypothetical protein [Cyanobacteria bacterium UBA9579]
MKNVLGIFILGLIIGFVTYFIKKPIIYIGYFYPNYEELKLWKESDLLESLEECRKWVNATADEYNDYLLINFKKEYDYNMLDYECGVDCRLGDDYGQGTKYTCKTTTQ